MLHVWSYDQGGASLPPDAVVVYRLCMSAAKGILIILRFYVYINLYSITPRCLADAVLMWSHLSSILFPLLWYIFFHLPPPCCSHRSYWANLPQSSSVFITSKNSLASLHLFSSLPPHTLSHLSPLLPSAFRFRLLLGPYGHCTCTPAPFQTFLWHISLLPSVAPPPRSFPPANCWTYFWSLACLFLFSCHIFMKKILKFWSSSSVHTW